MDIEPGPGEVAAAVEKYRERGVALLESAHFAEAISFIEEARREMSRRFGPLPAPASFLDILGLAYRRIGLLDFALGHFLEAEEASRGSPDDPESIAILNNLGLAYCDIGEIGKSGECLESARLRLESRGDAVGANAVNSNIGFLLVEEGRPEEALSLLGEAEAKARALGDEGTRAAALDSAGAALDALGRADEAESSFREAAAILDRLGLRPERLDSSRHLARGLLRWGRPAEAEELAASASREAASLGLGLLRADLELVRAEALGALGRWRESAESYRSYVGRSPEAELSRGKLALSAHLLEGERERALSLFLKVRRRNEDLARAQATLIEALAALAEVRDDATGGHIRRTKRYVDMLAMELARRGARGLDRRKADIGKVGVADAVLHKAGPLDKAEFEEMKRHPLIGERVVEAARWAAVDSAYAAAALEIIGAHHERWDGKGYPRGLAGEAIPLGGRVMAVADAYDAIRSRRTYKGKRSHVEARDFIAGESGASFDPVVVEAFLAINEDFADVFESLGP
jgi:tetratricopeptide (TPR) repeat protein